MVAMMRIFASHLGQRSASKPKGRRSSTAQSRRDDIAKAETSSAPSPRRRCCSRFSLRPSPPAWGSPSEEVWALAFFEAFFTGGAVVRLPPFEDPADRLLEEARPPDVAILRAERTAPARQAAP